MSTDSNMALVRSCVVHASSGDYGALDDILAPGFVLHPAGARGAEGLAELAEGYRSVLADLTITVEHQFGAGDYVASRATLRGRHEGEFMGIAPTGREVAVDMIVISRCREGRIAEEWELVDTLALMRQIGALPEAAPA